MTAALNPRAYKLATQLAQSAASLRIDTQDLDGGGRIIDCGVHAEGSLQAGIAVARVCLSDLADVSLVAGEIDSVSWPHVQVLSDDPVAACLLSQYAGWQISVGKFFAMGSGPMRAVAAVEPLFEKLNYREASAPCVGVLEAAKLPGDAVFEYISDKTNVPRRDLVLLVAPTSSVAGNLQVVARSMETALHKLLELGFDVRRIRSGFGTAPLSPVAADDLTGIGRTNDAILYGGRVTLFVTGDDESLADVGSRVPSASSACYGRPFLEVFEAAGRDFYQIDPHLFSPAEIVFHNIETGRVQHFGQTAPAVLRQSFGF